ncbi:MAG: acetolactate synthase small subunit [Bacillota bacterium]|jgi:acetolactate synthase-1/3 small subunit
MRKITIAMLVSHQSNVLTRISGMFARRCFNIETIAAGPTEDKTVNRITITMYGDDHIRDQVIKQLDKLHDVYEIREMLPEDTICRELAIMKVATNADNRRDVMDAVTIFRYRIIDYTPGTLCIQMTGSTNKIDTFIEMMEPYGILEICRTGVLAINKGLNLLKIRPEE